MRASASGRFIAAIAIAVGFIASVVASTATAADKLQVHEWGTFTALQDENGRSLGGINIDDEPVPSFVYNLNRHILANSNSLRSYWSKGLPQRHPYVTMRLETPIIYFYPPAGETEPFKVDVDVSFRGGWLTEFYPNAAFDAPGVAQNKFEFGPLTSKTTGRLAWVGLKIGGQHENQYPKTNEHVWTAPRNVKAATVTIGGESEKYLFYRGVGNFNSPLRVTTDKKSGDLTFFSNLDKVLGEKRSVGVPAVWLVDVREGGRVAFRSLGGLTATNDPAAAITKTSSQFNSSDFSTDNLDRLHKAMHAELVQAGLFADEATAMLSTWQRAYFKSVGLRAFYVAPRIWTDHHLPLKISRDADIARVMIGRIELITPRHRQLLERIATTKLTETDWVAKARQSANFQKFASGHSDFGDLGVKIPDEYQAYLDLGRFRNALVIDEENKRATGMLSRFIDFYGLESFRVPDGEKDKSEAKTAAKQAGG